MAAYQRERRERALRDGPAVVDATPTHRRIQALLAVGWTGAELAERLGSVRRENVKDILEQSRVLRTTEARIARIYSQLEAIPGGSDLNRSRSKAKGWAVPFAYDDIATDAAPVDQRRRSPSGKSTKFDQRLSAQETLYEYQHLRYIGWRHSDALEELGISQEGYDKCRERVRT